MLKSEEGNSQLSKSEQKAPKVGFWWWQYLSLLPKIYTVRKN